MTIQFTPEETKALTEAHKEMQRAVICAVALTGVPDPAEFVRRVRALLETLATAEGFPNEADRLLAMLPPKP